MELHSFMVGQAFNGSFSHHERHSQYAIDISLPLGTPVCAARDGVIMDIESDFFSGGTDKEEYGERANMVTILHDDGTMAIYAHLSLESVRYGIGTRVSEGEVIADSGNTGYSSGPHLHFVIQKNDNMRLASVPFKLEDGKNGEIRPAQGMLLTAF